ncbi:MAG: type II toxin-antitoxin system death-on-curing family toxin [Eubacteriales bacterium]
MKRITKQQVVTMHQSLIKSTGGAECLRDEGLLDSALNAPFQTYEGIDVYASLLQKAARLGFGIVNNHAFIDGNKRIGAHVMLVFLELNGIELTYSQEELYTLILDTASGKTDIEYITSWIINHTT